MVLVLIGEHQHRDGPGDADRPAAPHRLDEIFRLPVLEEEPGRRSGGCRLAAVISRHVARRRVVVEQERTAPEPGGLRLHQAQHGLDREGGVDGGAALPQDLQSGVDGMRIGRCDHGSGRPVFGGQRLDAPGHGVRGAGWPSASGKSEDREGDEQTAHGGTDHTPSRRERPAFARDDDKGGGG